jgi:penicillin-binding protein 1A
MDKALPLARTAGGSHRYFTDWVVDQLPEYIGRVDGDLEVLTTLQPSLQSLADAAIRKWMEAEGNSKKASQAAMVVMQPDGAIQAIIGGRNYAESQYNRATQAKRQPGSAFKLLVYLAALEAGYTPETLVSDRPITIGNWSPKNYTEDYRGDIPLKEGFYRSINTVAAMITHRVGAARVVEMARRLGIKSKLTATPSIALGTNDVSLLEMTTAYADIAAGGKALRPFVIQEIRNKQGKLLYRHPNSGIEQVIATSTVRQMNELLMSVVHSGTARKAMIGRPVAGKTGTTQDYRDAWFMGFTPQLVAGVWVGNDNYTPMQKVTGGGIPTQIWADFMKSALVGKPALPIPTNIVYDGTAAVPMQSGDPSQPVPEGTDIGEALPPTSPDAPAESELIPTEEIPQNEGEGVFDWYEKHQQQGQQPKEEPVEDDGTLLDSLYDKIQSGEVEYSYPNDRERRR